MSVRVTGGRSRSKRSEKGDGAEISPRGSGASRSSKQPANVNGQKRTLELPALRRFHTGYRWDGIEIEPYKLRTHKGGEYRGASRQVLIGRGGEQVRFHVRYFEIARGGFTSLEHHRHSHVVIGLRGRGRVRVGEKHYLIGRMDMIYIAPGQSHQLAAAGRGPFGFLCIVDARRDRPRPVAK